MSKIFDRLYGVSSKGKIKEWQVSVHENVDHTSTIITHSGFVGQTIKETRKIIKKGKNVGRANETTTFQQALNECVSNINLKRHQNYEPILMDLSSYEPRYMLPMLAKNPGKGKIVYPAYIQPKLNGICNLAEYTPTDILHHSRGGHCFNTIPHITHWLSLFKSPYPLHGELYKHGWSLQKIGSYTKKLKSDYELLEYWLYDIACTTMKFEERWNLIMDIQEFFYKYPDAEKCLKITPTFLVNNMDEAKKYHDSFIGDGFEGAMLKNVNGIYIFQYNSMDIEKMKLFDDAEFEIIGGKEGSGTDDGCIIYRCVTENGHEFDVRPRGTVQKRQRWFKDLDNAIGLPLTVRFPELTESGIPAQPVGLAIRDYE